MTGAPGVPGGSVPVDERAVAGIPSYTGPELGPVTITCAQGERRVDAQSIAVDQSAFAVRLPGWRTAPAPGVRFRARTIDLRGGGFTNSYELAVDVDRVAVAAVSCADGFALRSALDRSDGGRTGPVAAVSGTFSFISDDHTYGPVEPCLDLCWRDGVLVSLPTATKPALLIVDGRPVVRDVAARGTLTVGGRPFDWIGSKLVDPHRPPPPGRLEVRGAANCRVVYRPDGRTGFQRFVDPAENRTPRSPDRVDLVVVRSGTRHVVTHIRPGGGSDLFAASWVLTARTAGPGASLPPGVAVGAPVDIRTVDDLDCARVSSGWSVGPNAGAAAAGRPAAYDESLGTSPFGDGTRYPRTLIGIHDGRLLLRVLDGAPLAPGFRGVSCPEVVDLLRADGVPASAVHHLDGGQSSKIALRERDAVRLFGSMHYLRWPRLPQEPFRWQGSAGRRLRSAVVIGGRR